MITREPVGPGLIGLVPSRSIWWARLRSGKDKRRTSEPEERIDKGTAWNMLVCHMTKYNKASKHTAPFVLIYFQNNNAFCIILVEEYTF
jgi:hypothetical protein